MKRRALIAAVPGAVAAIAGCGGGGGGDFASVGSGGTGISGGEGVGSGGTGITSAAVGAITGFGSIIVNGVRYDTDRAVLTLTDTDALKLGMTVRVRGVVDPDLLNGVASSIESSADARGPVAHIDLPNGILVLWYTKIRTDASTVFAGGLTSLEDLQAGDPVQVWGLPDSGIGLRATRVERVAAGAAPIISGTAQAVDVSASSVQVGGLRVGFTPAVLEAAGLSPSQLEGQLVRVRGTDADAMLTQAALEPWYPVTPADSERLSLEGLITRFDSLASLQVDGVPVDASDANLSGRRDGIGLGARVQIEGAWRNGVLVASRLKLREPAPEPGDADSQEDDYSARGNIGAFRSASDFKIQGQDIDAGGAGVVFLQGTAADLRNGRRVYVTGSRVTNDRLIAERVEFL
jgi:hypothetical protein